MDSDSGRDIGDGKKRFELQFHSLQLIRNGVEAYYRAYLDGMPLIRLDPPGASRRIDNGFGRRRRFEINQELLSNVVFEDEVKSILCVGLDNFLEIIQSHIQRFYSRVRKLPPRISSSIEELLSTDQVIDLDISILPHHQSLLFCCVSKKPADGFRYTHFYRVCRQTTQFRRCASINLVGRGLSPRLFWLPSWSPLTLSGLLLCSWHRRRDGRCSRGVDFRAHVS